jgi:hypothetical protein
MEVSTASLLWQAGHSKRDSKRRLRFGVGSDTLRIVSDLRRFVCCKRAQRAASEVEFLLGDTYRLLSTHFVPY